MSLDYCGYKVIYSNSARFRLHYYFLNLHLQYAVLSIIIYFTFTFGVRLGKHGCDSGTCTGRGAVMHFFFPFSAAIGDRRSVAIGAAAWRDRSYR